jgi:DNA/RNA-binding domain of Phe-tRNA-synthetase-like protein
MALLVRLPTDHPLLEVGAFVARLPRPLGELATPPAITALAAPGAAAPLASSDAVKTHVRDLLRAGGFKPAGRSKPASEYLAGAQAEGRFPAINALVDACNVVSLHSGLPISLVDVERVTGALAIRVAPAGTTYPFNPTGQVIDASGLICLHDDEGPTGTPVKDAQRTKTHDGTRVALAIVWGTRALPGRATAAARWYREVMALLDGVTTEDVQLR